VQKAAFLRLRSELVLNAVKEQALRLRSAQNAPLRSELALNAVKGCFGAFGIPDEGGASLTELGFSGINSPSLTCQRHLHSTKGGKSMAHSEVLAQAVRFAAILLALPWSAGAEDR